MQLSDLIIELARMMAKFGDGEVYVARESRNGTRYSSHIVAGTDFNYTSNNAEIVINIL